MTVSRRRRLGVTPPRKTYSINLVPHCHSAGGRRPIFRSGLRRAQGTRLSTSHRLVLSLSVNWAYLCAVWTYESHSEPDSKSKPGSGGPASVRVLHGTSICVSLLCRCCYQPDQESGPRMLCWLVVKNVDIYRTNEIMNYVNRQWFVSFSCCASYCYFCTNWARGSELYPTHPLLGGGVRQHVCASFTPQSSYVILSSPCRAVISLISTCRACNQNGVL